MNGSQINKGLALEKIRSIRINDTNELLEEIIESEKVRLLTEHRYLSPYLRKSALALLYKAADSLPIGYKLLVVTAYRPLWMQRELYRRRMNQLAVRHPFKMIFQNQEWKSMVNRYTSPPGGSSHQYGGAVDVTVIDDQGKRLDMGTTLTDYGEKVHTGTLLINEEQRNNRRLLYQAMTKVGFVNYPLEWWHYSYGDRIWAAYSERHECFYGPIEEK